MELAEYGLGGIFYGLVKSNLSSVHIERGLKLLVEPDCKGSQSETGNSFLGGLLYEFVPFFSVMQMGDSIGWNCSDQNV